MYVKCSFFLMICAVLCALGAERSNTKQNDGETLISTLKDILKQPSDDAAHDQSIEGLYYKLYSELQGMVTDIIRRLNASEDFTSAKEKLITRTRRNIGQDLPSNGCTPGSIGCPSGAYTPYFMGQCIMCPPGPPGPQGSPGNEGDRGRDGRDGRDGERGPKGDDGDCDSTSNVNSNQQTFAERHHPSSNHSGAIYVRWGRTECPSTSELVYTGVAGGEYYTHKGGASNFICMPQEPIYDEPEASAHNSRGFVFGVEYQTTSYPPYAHLHDNDVPCAVCKALRRYSYIMVPARNICPGSEWTLEYSGHLMTDHYTHRRREYICLDRNAEAIPRSVADVNGGLLYPVEGRCFSSGGIPCGPYVHGYELTCAICTL